MKTSDMCALRGATKRLLDLAEAGYLKEALDDVPDITERLAKALESSEPKLTQCPFCGFLDPILIKKELCWVGCTSCRASGPREPTPGEAVSEWNRIASLVLDPQGAGALESNQSEDWEPVDWTLPDGYTLSLSTFGGTIDLFLRNREGRLIGYIENALGDADDGSMFKGWGPLYVCGELPTNLKDDFKSMCAELRGVLGLETRFVNV